MNIFILIFNYLTYFICGKKNFNFNDKKYILNYKLNNTFDNKEYNIIENNDFSDDFLNYDIINDPMSLPTVYQCKCGKFVEKNLECCEKKFFIPISNKSIFLNC